MPIPDEIRKRFEYLQMNDPMIYACMAFVSRGEVTLQEALMVAVVELHRQLETYRETELATARHELFLRRTS